MSKWERRKGEGEEEGREGELGRGRGDVGSGMDLNYHLKVGRG